MSSPIKPPAERMVISWFGYEVRNMEDISNSHYCRWVEHFKELVESLGMRIERLGNPIDMIVGREDRSISRHEFFRFQDQFDALNEEMGLHMSGLLWLHGAESRERDPGASERYQDGRRVQGASIGRPSCHSIKNAVARKRDDLARTAATRTIDTAAGALKLLGPDPKRLARIRMALPFGMVSLDRPVEGAWYGINMEYGDGAEMWAVKQQSPDVPSGAGRDLGRAHAALIAVSVAGYREMGFDGCLVPCTYARQKSDKRVEAGICYFGKPSADGIEVTGFPFAPAFDERFGHGFTAMLGKFIRSLQASARESGVDLQPCLGLEPRPRSQLGSVDFAFAVHGQDVYYLNSRVDAQDPVWTALRSTGIEKVYWLPGAPWKTGQGR